MPISTMKLNMSMNTYMMSTISMHMLMILRSWRVCRIGTGIDIPGSSTRMRTFPIRIISICIESERPLSAAATNIHTKEKGAARLLFFVP